MWIVRLSVQFLWGSCIYGRWNRILNIEQWMMNFEWSISLIHHSKYWFVKPKSSFYDHSTHKKARNRASLMSFSSFGWNASTATVMVDAQLIHLSVQSCPGNTQALGCLEYIPFIGDQFCSDIIPLEMFSCLATGDLETSNLPIACGTCPPIKLRASF